MYPMHRTLRVLQKPIRHTTHQQALDRRDPASSAYGQVGVLRLGHVQELLGRIPLPNLGARRFPCEAEQDYRSMG